MESDRPFHGLASFPMGTRVRIGDRSTLEEFLRTWQYHHKLESDQLDFAGRVTSVEDIFMYHGGDIIYKLQNAPGLWHQQLLEVA